MKILVVDDSLAMRRLVSKLLQSWEYDVVEAKDGVQAWEAFQSAPTPIVITDWIMPELDGVELTRRIRSFNAPTYVYVMLLTAKTEKEDLVQAMEAGADDFLSKPVDKEELRVRLRAGERIINLEQSLAEKNRKLRDTQSAMVQQEKLASLGQLAAGMAHEINNPIAYVTNNVVVLQREFDTIMTLLNKYRSGGDVLSQAAPQLAEELAELEEESDVEWLEESLPRLLNACGEGLGRVRDIVKNLREFARLDEAKFDRVDLKLAVESTIEILRHELTKHTIELKTEFCDAPPVLCFPSKINQVFLNILVNAIQASQPNDVIHIRTITEPDHVVVEIQDHGTGIANEHLPHIFEPFFTTKPVGQGTGLGLAISYGIVQDTGGEIDVETEFGQGSTFRVRLPINGPEGAGEASE